MSARLLPETRVREISRPAAFLVEKMRAQVRERIEENDRFTAANASEAVFFLYDGFLPLKTTWGGTVVGNVEAVYNDDFVVTSRKVNGTTVASFTRDDDLLLTAAGGLTLTRDADNGLLLGSTIGSLTTTHDWSLYGEVAAFDAAYSTTGLLAFDYTRDNLGRITTLEETVGATVTTWEFEYDVAGRLVEVTKDGVVDATFGWDDNSNRTSVTTSSTVSATYDDQDRLVTFGDFTYGWTKAGELESKVNSVTSDAWSYTYDELGNLVAAELPDGTQLDFVIDGLNRRVGKKRDGVYEQGFLYQDGLNPIAELDGSNVVVATFVYGTRANVPDLVIKSGTTYRVLTDHLGSVRLVVNTSTGAIAQEMAYDVWGNVLVDTSPGFQPFGFAGGLYDRDLELVRFGARDYDPHSARWTAKDPILFEGGDTNLYGYVLQDPVNKIDPNGKDPYENFAEALAEQIGEETSEQNYPGEDFADADLSAVICYAQCLQETLAGSNDQLAAELAAAAASLLARTESIVTVCGYAADALGLLEIAGTLQRGLAASGPALAGAVIAAEGACAIGCAVNTPVY